MLCVSLSHSHFTSLSLSIALSLSLPSVQVLLGEVLHRVTDNDDVEERVGEWRTHSDGFNHM